MPPLDPALTGGAGGPPDAGPPGAGGAPGAAPPGGPPGGAPPPMTPKSPIGGPGGPGSSPMLSPGANEGRKAAAVQTIKGLMSPMLAASMAFEAGSKEQQAILRAVSALNPLFGRVDANNLVPAGIAAMAQTAKKGPLSASPPPGLMPDSSPGNMLPPPPGGGGAGPEGPTP